MSRRNQLQPGQFFRNTDSQGCVQRIKSARAIDLAELTIALDRERASKARRSRVVVALRRRIDQLEGSVS